MFDSQPPLLRTVVPLARVLPSTLPTPTTAAFCRCPAAAFRRGKHPRHGLLQPFLTPNRPLAGRRRRGRFVRRSDGRTTPDALCRCGRRSRTSVRGVPWCRRSGERPEVYCTLPGGKWPAPLAGWRQQVMVVDGGFKSDMILTQTS